MNLIESVKLQMEVYSRVTTEFLRWRPILVLSVLQVTPPSLILRAMKETDGACRKPSESGLRRMLADTAHQMGLPELPKGGASGGRPSAESCERYRREHAAPWILANGGMPRAEQLADPYWDLRPQPPPSSGHAPAIPDASDSVGAKMPTRNSEFAESPATALSTTPAPVASAPDKNPEIRGKQGATGKKQPARGMKGRGPEGDSTGLSGVQHPQHDSSGENGKPESEGERLQRLLKENTSSLKKNKDGEIVSTRLPTNLRDAIPRSPD
jgi:hypothetical protein